MPYLDPQLARTLKRVAERGSLSISDDVELEDALPGLSRAEAAGYVWTSMGGDLGMDTTVMLTRRGRLAISQGNWIDHAITRLLAWLARA